MLREQAKERTPAWAREQKRSGNLPGPEGRHAGSHPRGPAAPSAELSHPLASGLHRGLTDEGLGEGSKMAAGEKAGRTSETQPIQRENRVDSLPQPILGEQNGSWKLCLSQS